MSTTTNATIGKFPRHVAQLFRGEALQHSRQKTGKTLGSKDPSYMTALAAGAIVVLLALAALAPAANAQGSRKDDIVFGTTRHPVSGATVRVCQAGATGTPCSPLATI